MNAQDQHNLVRFLIDLAGKTDGHGKGFDAADYADYRERVGARQRPERSDPPPEDLGGSKRPHEGKGKRRWPVRVWWDQ